MKFCPAKIVIVTFAIIASIICVDGSVDVQSGQNDDDEDFTTFERSIKMPSKLHGIKVIGDSVDEIDDDTQGRKVKIPKISDGTPIYHAGHDKQHRPFWVFDMGRVGLPKFIAEKKTKNLLKWLTVIYEEMQESIEDAVAEGHNVTGYTFVFDVGGNFLSHFSSRKLMAGVKLMVDYFLEDDISLKLQDGAFINVGPLTALCYESLGMKESPVLKNLPVYGTDVNVWKAALLEKISKDQLPPEFGGETTGYTPAALFPIKGKTEL